METNQDIVQKLWSEEDAPTIAEDIKLSEQADLAAFDAAEMPQFAA